MTHHACLLSLACQPVWKDDAYDIMYINSLHCKHFKLTSNISIRSQTYVFMICPSSLA